MKKQVMEVWELEESREIKRDVKTYKSGASLTIRTVEDRVRVMVRLECGHSREQHNGMRDITKAKMLACWECERAAAALAAPHSKEGEHADH